MAFLSRERLQALINLTGSEAAAIELHQKTLCVGCELMKVIATIEIALRNIVVANLSQHFKAAGWLQNPSTRCNLKQPEQTSITQAISQARRAVYAKLSRTEKAALDRQAFPRGLPTGISHRDRVKERQGKIIVSDGKVVAELTLNFWKRLYGPRYEHTLWRPTLKRTFPNPKIKRSQVATQLETIYQSRNRLAHHEPVLHDRFTRTIKAIEFVAPELGTHPDTGDTPLSRLLRDEIDRASGSGKGLSEHLRAFGRQERQK